MTNLENKSPDLIDRVLDSIRSEPVDPDEAARAADRVRGRLFASGNEHQETSACERFHSELQAHLDGTLSPGRRLLLEDHLMECVACRRESARRRNPAKAAAAEASADAASTPRPARRRARPFLLGVAAALLTAFAGAAWYFAVEHRPIATPSIAKAGSVSGRLLLIGAETNRDAAAAEAIPGGRSVRTARGSRAELVLFDDSRIEMNERTEIRMSRSRRGTVIELARGDIIVNAAPQASALFVKTGDLEIRVTGTVFSVSSGTAGSRVSVYEGDVEVRGAGRVETLEPGEQMASGVGRGPIPLEEQVAWSERMDSYLALIEQIDQVSREMADRPGRVLASRRPAVLDIFPEGTVLCASMPNLSRDIPEARALLAARLGSQAPITDWWEGLVQAVDPAERARFETFLGALQNLGDAFGREFFLAAVIEPGRRFPLPVGIAETNGSDAAVLERLNDLVRAIDPDRRAIRTWTDDAAGGDDDAALYLMVRGGFVVAAPSKPLMDLMAASIDEHAAGRPAAFSRTPFFSRIEQGYRAGYDWAVFADLESMVGALEHGLEGEPAQAARLRAVFDRLGFLGLQHFQMASDGDDRLTATLFFSNPRVGVASWLAEPAPMGSLGFVSEDAVLLHAFVFKDGAAMLEDAIRLSQALAPGAGDRVREFDQNHNVDLARELAAPIGGELALALDGPVLPMPAWKVVVEVYDPSRLQATIEKLIALCSERGAEGPSLAVHDDGDRICYAVSGFLPIDVWYTFADGYLVAAPNRALLDRAVAVHDSGVGIGGSPRLRDRLPAEGSGNVSFLAFEDLGSIVAPIVNEAFQTGRHELTAEQAATVGSWAKGSGPTVLYGVAGPDSIVVRQAAGRGSNLGKLALLSGVTLIEEIAEYCRQQNKRPGQAPR